MLSGKTSSERKEAQPHFKFLSVFAERRALRSRPNFDLNSLEIYFGRGIRSKHVYMVVGVAVLTFTVVFMWNSMSMTLKYVYFPASNVNGLFKQDTKLLLVMHDFAESSSSTNLSGKIPKFSANNAFMAVALYHVIHLVCNYCNHSENCYSIVCLFW